MGSIEILSTALSLVALVGCLFAYTRSMQQADRCAELAFEYDKHCLQLKNERERLASLERHADELGAQLRKLRGAFYASLREIEEPDNKQPENDKHELAPLCESYAIAQRDGPLSKAAQCTCPYCTLRRASKASFREREVPKTAAAQGELARLNAGKP